MYTLVATPEYTRGYMYMHVRIHTPRACASNHFRVLLKGCFCYSSPLLTGHRFSSRAPARLRCPHRECDVVGVGGRRLGAKRGAVLDGRRCRCDIVFQLLRARCGRGDLKLKQVVVAEGRGDAATNEENTL